MFPKWSSVVETFKPAWFTICMGTGAMQQVLVNFPYPQLHDPQWMRNLGYCFWILDIVLFSLFTLIILCQWLREPGSLRKTIIDFPSCSYLGAIPIAFDTIIEGLVSYYGSTDNGRWAAFALFWVNVVLTTAISFGLLMFQMTARAEHRVDDVAGVWLMTAVPLVIISATGASMTQLYSHRVNVLMIIMSFMLWSAGLILVHFILLIYFWRLIAQHLPPVQSLPSGFLPLAPLSQAATAVLNLCVALAKYLQGTLFTPTMSQPPPLAQNTIWAVGETFHFLGILIALFMLAHASFWAVQTSVAMAIKRPKRFQVGMWSLTFPIMSYTVAWATLGKDLRNDGMRGFAAALTVVSGLLWIVCAALTLWNGLITGTMFEPEHAPSGQKHDDRLRRIDSMQPGKEDDIEAHGNGGAIDHAMEDTKRRRA